ncbi:hypothetical protein CRUP_032776, partial [Coryphaenoides rupestris]
MAEIVNPPGKDFYPDKVKAYGPGLQSTGLAVGKPTEFTVRDNGNGTYACSYTPRKPIKHTVMVSWGGVNIPESPFRMNIGAGCHPNKVKVSGPGVAKTGLKAYEPTYFTVDCAEAGQGDISIGIKCAPGVVGPAEADIDFDIIRNDNDTFTVKYTPPGAGSYTIMVLFANQAIPMTPIRIKVDPSHDASKVKAEGPGLSRSGNHPQAQPPHPPQANNHHAHFRHTQPKRLQAIPMTPIRIKVDPSHDASKVKAEGPGLSRSGVELCKPTHFTVNTKGAGKAKLDCQFMAVTYGGDNVPKSPFNVGVAPTLDLNKINVTGLGN